MDKNTIIIENLTVNVNVKNTDSIEAITNKVIKEINNQIDINLKGKTNIK